MVNWPLVLGIAFFVVLIFIWFERRRRKRHRARVAGLNARPKPVVVPPPPPEPAPVVEAPSVFFPPSPPAAPPREPLPFLQKHAPEPELEIVKTDEDTGPVRVSRLASQQWDTMEVVKPKSQGTANAPISLKDDSGFVMSPKKRKPAAPFDEAKPKPYANPETPISVEEDSGFELSPRNKESARPIGDVWGDFEVRTDKKRGDEEKQS